MYQIDSKQVGCRLSEQQTEQINSVLTRLQENSETRISSFRDALMLLVDSVALTRESTEEKIDHNTDNMVLLTEEAKNEFKEHAINAGINLDNAIDNGGLTLIAQQINPSKDPEIQEVTKEIEVERSLSENEILIELNEEELQVAKKVQQNRGAALIKQGEQMETLQDLFKTCFFTKGNLYSFNGGWFTGL